MMRSMTRWAWVAGGLIALLLSGCDNMKNIGEQLGAALPGGQTSGTEVTSATGPASDYNGPRARLAVLRFSDATGGTYSRGRYWYSKDIGDGMARKLSSALLKTRRFRILNRKNMKDMMAEIGFGGSGAVQAGTAARFGRMVGARLVVTAAVTDFQENTGGTSSNVRNRKGVLGVLGNLSSASNSAYMAVNVEVVDVETSELLASEQLEAKITNVNLGAAVGNSLGVGSLSSWERQPRGKALQQVINKAVEFVATEGTIPSSYFTEAPTGGRRRIAPDRFASKMQGILKQLGYYNGALDGVIGPGSQNAIRSFQKDYDLDVTGALDPPTRDKLLALSN